MTYPPTQPQDSAAGSGEPQQPTYTSGSITQIEYKKPVDEEEEARKKKKAKGRKIRIFIVFAVLVMLIIVVLSAAMLYIFWPREQVLELENVTIIVGSDSHGRYWDIKAEVKNIGGESLDVSLITMRITGPMVLEDVTDDVARICLDNSIKTGSKTELEPDDTISFRTTEARVQEASVTTFDQSVTVKVYYDGDLMDEEKINVGGQW